MSAPTWPAMQGRTYARAPGFTGQAELRRREPHGGVDGERERRPAELGRVDPEQQVVHDRVADQRHLEHVGALDAGVARQFGCQLGETASDHARELLLRALVEHHVRDPAHQVLAEADLWVHLAGRREHVPCAKVAEVARDRGRADVERDSVRGVVETRPNGGDVRPVVNGNRDAKLGL